MENKNTKWARIDLDALKWNMRQVRRLAGPDVMVAAVVKANGYGHGALEIMDALLESGADVIVVSSVNEAVEMRKKYKKAQLLVLGATQPEDIEEGIRNGIIQTITSEEQARLISEAAKKTGMGASCHIKLDTGMNRIGFPVSEESAKSILRIASLPGIHVNGMFSHFATADEENKDFAHLQYERFCHMREMLEEQGLKIPVCHIANSAGIIDFPEVYMDMVRSGIITYGLYPSEEVDKSRIELHPAMELKARISHVKTIAEDSGISYGLTDTVKAGSVIATVPIGYADGYLRAFSNKAEVLVKGQRAKIRGRVCMDQLMIDVTHIPGVGVGDVVTLFGRDGDEEITVDELAELAGTISYELLCMIGRRVPRIYVENGEITKITNYLE